MCTIRTSRRLFGEFNLPQVVRNKDNFTRIVQPPAGCSPNYLFHQKSVLTLRPPAHKKPAGGLLLHQNSVLTLEPDSHMEPAGGLLLHQKSVLTLQPPAHKQPAGGLLLHRNIILTPAYVPPVRNLRGGFKLNRL